MTYDVVVAGTGNAALCAAREGGASVETGVRSLLTDSAGAVTGVVGRSPKGIAEVPARAVVLGCGGFEANLYAAGELVGGLFYHNYPGGAGLMAGSVFGKAAGASAAADIGAKAG